ncbi:MAG: hypothetical protein WCT18_01000 [Patescibacteria group bacterium]
MGKVFEGPKIKLSSKEIDEEAKKRQEEQRRDRVRFLDNREEYFGYDKVEYEDYNAKCKRKAKVNSYDELVETLVGEIKDKVIKNRKNEILGNVDLRQLIKKIPQDLFQEFLRGESYRARGYVFEYLANLEMNDAEENGLLGDFVLHCLRHPEIIGYDRPLRNPDHLGIVFDRENNQAVVTGMYECKTGKFDARAIRQFRSFYHNLESITAVLNDRLNELKDKYDLLCLPDGGIALQPFDSISKEVLVPMPTNPKQIEEFQQKKKEATSFGWNVRASVFNGRDVDILLNFIAKAEPRYETTKLRKEDR